MLSPLYFDPDIGTTLAPSNPKATAFQLRMNRTEVHLFGGETGVQRPNSGYCEFFFPTLEHVEARAGDTGFLRRLPEVISTSSTSPRNAET